MLIGPCAYKMNLSYESYKSLSTFENQLLSPEKYITSENKITDYIEESDTHVMSHQTIRNRIAEFKKAMYFSSYVHANPRFLSITEYVLCIPINLIHIHELMYQYFCGSTHQYLQFVPCECSISGFENTKFIWNIPVDFMPIFTAYLAALPTILKTNITVHDFFIQMDNIINYIYNTKKMTTDTFNFYTAWKQEHLASVFFNKLETMLETYAQNTEQRNKLILSVDELTNILLECPQRPSSVLSNVSLLLEHHIALLEKKTNSGKSAKRELVCLYPHNEDLEIPTEHFFINTLLKPMFDTTAQLLIIICNFLKENHQTDSLYELAVENHEIFLQKTSNHMNSLVHQKEQLEAYLCNYYVIGDDPDFINALSKGIISININNRKKRILTFYNLITNCYCQIEKRFSEFFKLVKKASGPNPERYKKLNTETTYFTALKKDILKYQDNLNSKLEDIFNKSPNILIFHSAGYLNNIKYPCNLFYEEDILKIFFVLSNIPYCISTDNVSSFLKSKGIIFPLYRHNVIELLNNFDLLANEFCKVYSIKKISL